jgi:hypothetical protein
MGLGRTVINWDIYGNLVMRTVGKCIRTDSN